MYAHADLSSLALGTSAAVDHPNPTSEPPPLSLVDMPLPWLEQLPSKGLSGTEDLALMRTCTFMRDQVLGRRPLRAEFRLPTKPDDTSAARHQARLLLATKYSNNVHLVLGHDLAEGFWAHWERTRTRKKRTDRACALLSGTMAAAGHPLNAIRAVDLTSVMLDAAVPSWLVAACPHVNTLVLEDCELIIEDRLPTNNDAGVGCSAASSIAMDSIPAGLAQLQHLELGSKHAPLLTCVTPPRLLAWQRQLNSLSALTSLTLRECPQQLSGCPNLLIQLTHLSLPGVYVTDEDMEVLLNMPRLTHVTCTTFLLKQSYSQRPCTWTHLVVEVLDVDQIDRLLLDTVTFIQASRDHIFPSHSLATCSRVAAAIAKCGGLKSLSTDITILSGVPIIHYDIHYHPTGQYQNDYQSKVPVTGPARTPCLAALLRMLAPTRFTRLVISNATITPELLYAVGEHLSGCSLTSIDFVENDWNADVWPIVLPSLPPGCNLVIQAYFSEDIHSEANVTAMCVAATRPVKVQLRLRSNGLIPWNSGWEERMRAATAAAGHQHLQLIIDWIQLVDD